MKRTILTGVMLIGLAATSAFAGSTIDTKQGGAGSKGKTAASTGSTMAASTGTTHKRRHHHRRHHSRVAHKHATTKSK